MQNSSLSSLSGRGHQSCINSDFANGKGKEILSSSDATSVEFHVIPQGHVDQKKYFWQEPSVAEIS